MKKILITFGDEKFTKSLKLLSESARDLGKVDAVLVYTQEWLKNTQFYKDNKFILTQPRGAGYWAWKPFIIKNAIQNYGSDDVIIYSDGGLQVIEDLSPLFDIADIHQKIIFKLPAQGVPHHKSKQWIKGDCFEEMGCNSEEYWNADMTNGAISVWKATPSNSFLMDEWLKYAKMPNVITDMRSLAPSQPEFREHRHDQAILSNMRVKYGWELFRDPTQYGEMEKGKFKNSPYNQLFWHHRNFKHPKP